MIQTNRVSFDSCTHNDERKILPHNKLKDSAIVKISHQKCPTLSRTKWTIGLPLILHLILYLGTFILLAGYLITAKTTSPEKCSLAVVLSRHMVGGESPRKTRREQVRYDQGDVRFRIDESAPRRKRIGNEFDARTSQIPIPPTCDWKWSRKFRWGKCGVSTHHPIARARGAGRTVWGRSIGFKRFLNNPLF